MRQYVIAAVAAVAAIGLASGVNGAPMIALTGVPSASHVQLAQATSSQATVSVKSAILRSAPNIKSKKLASLQRGTKLQVLDQSGEWTHVRAGTREGYVSSSLLSR